MLLCLCCYQKAQNLQTTEAHRSTAACEHSGSVGGCLSCLGHTWVWEIAVSLLQECNPSGKGSPKGLAIEGPEGSHDYRLPLLMRFFLFFFLTRALTCFLKKGTRKAHYSHRQRLLANERRFCPLLWWEVGRRGKLRWETEKSSPPCLHMHSVHLGRGFVAFWDPRVASCLTFGNALSEETHV